MDLVEGIVIWGFVAIASGVLAGILAGVKNRDYSFWIAWCFLFPPLLLFLVMLPRHDERLWIVILCFYPFVSALPQEIVFRALFFGRYGGLFPGPRVAIAANAGAFSLAHLFYWNWPAVILTLFGGALFAWAYREKKSFLFAWLMHALAGQIVFTTGLGIFFFHGAVR